MPIVPIKSLDELPCKEQTYEAVKVWMKANAKPGITVVIRQSQGHIWEYQTTQIIETTPRFIFIDKAPAWGGNKYYYSGKSTRYPTSKTHLIIPTPEILDAIAKKSQFIL